MDRTEPRSRRVDPVLAALAVLAALIVVGYGADLGGHVLQVVVCWLAMAAVHAVLAYSALRVRRMSGLEKATRRLWGTLGITGALYLAGDLAQLIAIPRDPLSVESAYGTAPQSVSVLIGTGLLVVVMLTSPLGVRTRQERARFWLDVATIMVSAAAFGFYAALPSAGRGTATTATATSPALAMIVGPGLFLLGVFAVVKMTLVARPPFTRAAGLLSAAAAAGEAVLQAMPASWHLHDRVSWVLGGHLLASLVLAASARVQQVQVQTEPVLLGRRPERPYAVLPYAAIAATYGLLIFVLWTSGLSGATWVVVAGSILSTTLVVGRQLASFRHIAQLLAERDELAAQLRYLAFHDNLTGLANRALFRQKLAAALEAGPGAGEVGVLLIDLDDFKPVNDRYGHAAGDQLLIEVGEWLRGVVRSGDTVARLGGDEFAVLVEEMPPGGHDAVVSRVTEAMRRRVALNGAPEVAVGASIGVAFGWPGERSMESLLHAADTAMYAAKARGKGTLVVCEGDVDRVTASVVGAGA